MSGQVLSGQGLDGQAVDADLMDQALTEYAVMMESGKTFHRDEFLKQYESIQPELEQTLDDIEKLNQLGLRINDQMKRLPPSAMLEGGMRFGKYQLVRMIGSGGMACVYEAIEESLGRKVALKLFTGVGSMMPDIQKRFAQEAKVIASLPHEHIVPVYATGSENGIPFISMKLMEGGTLASHAGKYSPQLIAVAGIQMARALAYAHSRGILHRDIKLANILLDDRGWAYLADFGLALIPGASRPQQIAGTLSHLCPEWISHPEVPPDQRGDIYSLGVSLYELAADALPIPVGEIPYTTRILKGHVIPLRSINRAIPEDLAQVIHKAMAYLPEDRYPSAEELARDLERFLAGRPVQARPLPWFIRCQRWSWRHAGLILAASISALLTLFLGMSWIIYQNSVYQKEQQFLLKQAREEQNLTRAAVTKMVEAARTFRHQPGLEDQERILLAKFLEQIEEQCRTLGPDHPLKAEEALITAQLYGLEMRTGTREKGEIYKKQALERLRLVSRNQPERVDVIRQLATMIADFSGAFIEENPREALLLNDEALFWINKALAVHPDWGSLRDRKIWIFLSRAKCLENLDHRGEARSILLEGIRECENLIEEFPTGHPLSYIRPAILWERIAELDAQEEKFQDADQAYQKALAFDGKLRELFPEDLHLRENVGLIGLKYSQFLLKNGQKEEAKKVFLQQEEVVKAFYRQFGYLDLAKGQYDLYCELFCHLCD